MNEENISNIEEDSAEEILSAVNENEENQEVQELTFESYSITSYVGMGLTVSGACVLFSIGVATIISILKRM